MFLSAKRLPCFATVNFGTDNKKREFKYHQDFWIPKIERNIARDKEVTKTLEDSGWTVLRFWGKEIQQNLKSCGDIIETAVRR